MAKAMFSAAAKADLQEKKALHLLSPLQSMCIQTDAETNHIPFAHVGTVSGSRNADFDSRQSCWLSLSCLRELSGVLSRSQ